ncbi:PP2C family protein-serine/threonine phosphatase [Streptomyces tsukubensis]|uniref:Translation initiation factor IF-2 n=1 Tax=Streptomyces tsukubensis TaxID=83656 RepID=A0A1V4AET7_9ACTN|nr:PP2C family protein-serine/threonine phosphatase [Streptomyces tsukubensis]OON82057.1 translation initiation factor IF-2 [Streptomyces tsukubensis]QFR92544.1 SpoIIE family protein phosphatase [Streptomyces tsukubensis]
MKARSTTHHSLPGLRTALRLLAEELRLPPELRSRLTLSVAAVAEGELRAGRTVTLEARPEPGPDGAPGATVELAAPHAPWLPPVADLPLPGERVPGATVWRLPSPAVPAWEPSAPAKTPAAEGTSEAGATAYREDRRQPTVELLEEELRTAVARADALAKDHQRLTRELEETNSGVLALYVQLEERDEQLRRAHGQMLQELEDALRPPPVRIEGLETAIHYAPAGTDAPTGGDLYDWFELPDGTVHITVVDALGHGVTSTRSALDVTHAVRTLALEGHPLESVVARTDEILLPFDRELMATVLLVRLDPATGRLDLANGSHPPALLVRKNGATAFLEVRGRGVGYPLPGSERVRHEQLDVGDLLVLYTDGLTESRRDPREGEKRLAEAAARHRGLPIEMIPGALADEMHTVILHPDDTLALTVRRVR